MRRRRVCLSLMAGMRHAPGIAEEGERALPSGARPPRAIGAPGVVKVVGGMGWATTSALGGWPLVRSPSVDKSAVSRYSRSAFGPVPLSRSDAHGIGRGCHYQGRHLPFHQGPATLTPRDERTELVSFHRSAKAPHAHSYPARRTVGLDRSLAINRGKTTDVQDKGSCGLGGVCLLTGQVGGLAATATRSDEGQSQAHFTPFQSYSSITSPLSAALRRGHCRPDLHVSAPSDQRRRECLAEGGGGGGGGVYLESYTREARFLTRWDQHAVALRRP